MTLLTNQLLRAHPDRSTGDLYLSPSQAATYRRCPALWSYQYPQGLRDNSHQAKERYALGSLVSRVMERVFAYDSMPDMSALGDLTAEAVIDAVRDECPDDVETALSCSRAMAECVITHYPGARVTARECPAVRYVDKGFALYGIPDLELEYEGQKVCLDWKTQRSNPPRYDPSRYDSDLQAHVYAYLLRQSPEDIVTTCQVRAWVGPRRSPLNDPHVVLIDTTPGSGEPARYLRALDTLESSMRSVAEGILRVDVEPTMSYYGSYCGQCFVRGVCQADVEGDVERAAWEVQQIRIKT